MPIVLCLFQMSLYTFVDFDELNTFMKQVIGQVKQTLLCMFF